MNTIDIQFEELNEDLDISFSAEVEIPKGYDDSKNALKNVANSYGGEILDETPFSDYAPIFEEIIEERAEEVTAELEKTKEQIPVAYENGQKAEYDRFWDAYQDNGNRTSYQFAFAGLGWNAETFKPKYDINAKDLATGFTKTQITDLAGILKAQGVKLNTEGSVSFLQCFQASTVTHVPEIDARNSTNMSYSFSANSIKRIDKLKVSAKTPYQNTFTSFLDYIIIEGEIGQNGLNVRGALPKECLLSIVNCLSTTTNGLSVVLGKNAVNKAFETSEGANDGSTSQEWTDLIATRSNWTISLS